MLCLMPHRRTFKRQRLQDRCWDPWGNQTHGFLGRMDLRGLPERTLDPPRDRPREIARERVAALLGLAPPALRPEVSSEAGVFLWDPLSSIRRANSPPLSISS